MHKLSICVLLLYLELTLLVNDKPTIKIQHVKLFFFSNHLIHMDNISLYEKLNKTKRLTYIKFLKYK